MSNEYFQRRIEAIKNFKKEGDEETFNCLTNPDNYYIVFHSKKNHPIDSTFDHPNRWELKVSLPWKGDGTIRGSRSIIELSTPNAKEIFQWHISECAALRNL